MDGMDRTSIVTEMTTTERVAYATYLILEGAELTTGEVARRTGVTWQGAEQMLDRASRTVPIVKWKGKWKRFT